MTFNAAAMGLNFCKAFAYTTAAFAGESDATCLDDQAWKDAIATDFPGWAEDASTSDFSEGDATD